MIPALTRLEERTGSRDLLQHMQPAVAAPRRQCSKPSQRIAAALRRQKLLHMHIRSAIPDCTRFAK